MDRALSEDREGRMNRSYAWNRFKNALKLFRAWQSFSTVSRNYFGGGILYAPKRNICTLQAVAKDLY